MGGEPIDAGPRTRLGVLGWPVAHSLSPAIQNAALRAAGLAGWRYQLLPAPPERLTEIVRALPVAGFRGVNVTLPHKRPALGLADEAGRQAREIGAANTLLFEGGLIRAENTDGPALLQALPLDLAGRSAVVLGAGGSARAALWALREAGAREVQVWNRTPGRAAALAGELGARTVARPQQAEVLVNCTSVGLGDPALTFRELPLDEEQVGRFVCVVDFVYRPAGTALVAAARSRGVQTVDGLELLVAQGALAFELFTGRSAPVAEMRVAAAA